MAKTQKRSILTRLLSAVTAVSSAICMLPAMPNLSAAAAEFDLRIDGTTVTSTNASDIDGYGRFSYDIYNKVLTVNGSSRSSNSCMIDSNIEGLTINVTADSTLWTTAQSCSCILLSKSTTITGPGKLNAVSRYGAGIDAEADLNITDANVEACNQSDIESHREGVSCSGSLTIQNSTVTADGTRYGIKSRGISIIHSNVEAFGTEAAVRANVNVGIELTDCEITAPQGAVIAVGFIFEENGDKAKAVQIKEGRSTYDLWIFGTQVNQANADDILGDGIFSYNDITNTLTVFNSFVNTSDEDIIHNNIKDLTVNCANYVSFINEGSGKGIYSEEDLTITGRGRLEINTEAPAIMTPGATLTIKDADLDVTGNYGITGYPDNDKLIVINSTIHAAGSCEAICDFENGIELRDSYIESPEGGYILGGSIVNSDGSDATSVTIKPERKYELYIAGVQVANSNCEDILGDGTVSYNALYNTLSLKGDIVNNISSGVCINNNVKNLTINVISDSKLTASRGSGIVSAKDTTITGNGKLTIDAGATAIHISDATMTIKDANLEVTGNNYGITGASNNDKLIAINSKIHSEGNSGAVCDFCDGIEMQDCYITVPENAVISGTSICNSDGSKAKTVDIMPGSALAITKQPENASGCIGDKVQFTIEAEGNGLIYQWQYYNTETKKWENTGLAGNKTPKLSVSVLASRNGMKYHCIVKDASGTKLTSTAAKLIVNPKIVTQPVDASGCVGDKVQFTVEATGIGLIYQWQYYNISTKKWENTGLAGNKTPTLTVSVLANRDGMKYHCIVKDTNGTKLTSTAAKLIVNPKIVTQPVDASGCIGDKVQFIVEATGAGLIYQWQYYNTSTKKWENTGLTGNQTPTLTVTVTSARNGMKYHCIVKDSAGTKLTSTAAALKVLPKIVTQPKNVTASVNSTAKFTVEATGIGLTYQWQYYNTSTKKWENTGLAGNKTATLSVIAIASRNGMKYHCIVMDSAGNKLTSTAATLTVK